MWIDTRHLLNVISYAMLILHKIQACLDEMYADL